MQDIGKPADCVKISGRRDYRPVAPVARLVASAFGMPLPQLRSRVRFRNIVRLRQVAMWLGHRLGCSYASMGRWFRLDHTTVLHARRKIDALRRCDSELRELTDRLLMCARGLAPPPSTPPPPEPPCDPDEDLAMRRHRMAFMRADSRFRQTMLASGEV